MLATQALGETPLIRGKGGSERDNESGCCARTGQVFVKKVDLLSRLRVLVCHDKLAV